MGDILWSDAPYGLFTFILITLVLGGAGAWATGQVERGKPTLTGFRGDAEAFTEELKKRTGVGKLLADSIRNAAPDAVASGVTAAAVCEAAARWPATERPASTARTGIVALTRRAVRANLRGLPNDSMYSTASLVAPSCSHHISMSLLDTSSLFPTDANEEIPIPSRER